MTGDKRGKRKKWCWRRGVAVAAIAGTGFEEDGAHMPVSFLIVAMNSDRKTG